MVRLSKIYTKTGDAGQTGLGDGARVSKADPRVEAYGEVDEANAAVGLAVAAAPDTETGRRIREILTGAQNDLFDVGADLCAPIERGEKEGQRLRITPEEALRLEKAIDEFNARLTALTSFVLPGGSELACRLHVARTVARRAERRVAALLEREPERTSRATLVYLNRLSDLLFVLARVANDDGRGDALWKPGEGRGG